MTGPRPCLFGEVLFDRFPDGARVLGGAPFNVAWHLQAFGQAPYFISRVGTDADGTDVRRAMQDWGMDTGGLQTDPVLPTGRVQVSFTAGEPAYEIVHPCAYDAIAAPAQAPSCPILYHGSLALRDQRSRSALHGILAGDPGLVFVDVNLRPPWWDPASLEAMLSRADWVKLNADELTRLGATDGNGAGFVQRHGLRGLILTHGAGGAELLTGDGGRFRVRPTAAAEVVDTVGAGDAFAAVTLLGLARGWPYELTLQRAQAFASAIVGIRGATPADRAFYQPFIQAWEAAR